MRMSHFFSATMRNCTNKIALDGLASYLICSTARKQRDFNSDE